MRNNILCAEKCIFAAESRADKCSYIPHLGAEKCNKQYGKTYITTTYRVEE